MPYLLFRAVLHVLSLIGCASRREDRSISVISVLSGLHAACCPVDHITEMPAL